MHAREMIHERGDARRAVDGDAGDSRHAKADGNLRHVAAGCKQLTKPFFIEERRNDGGDDDQAVDASLLRDPECGIRRGLGLDGRSDAVAEEAHHPDSALAGTGLDPLPDRSLVRVIELRGEHADHPSSTGSPVAAHH